jgi:hypothetical protein
MALRYVCLFSGYFIAAVIGLVVGVATRDPFNGIGASVVVGGLLVTTGFLLGMALERQ